MGAEIDVSELNTLAAELKGATWRIASQGAKAVQKTGHDVVRDAQAFAPVDTGNLRNSIGVDFDSDRLGFEAGPTASYAPYLEWGTSRMGPHAFMGPAFDRNVPAFIAASEELGGVILD